MGPPWYIAKLEWFHSDEDDQRAGEKALQDTGEEILFSLEKRLRRNMITLQIPKGCHME